MIIFRYLARELFGAFFLSSLLLLLIFISNQFARYLSLVAAGKIAGWQLVHLLLLELPQLLSIILPLAFYLSILLSYGRLYGDNEITILTACGVGQKKLLQMTLLMALAVAAPVAAMTLWLNPVVAQARNQLLDQIKATSILETLLPGRFQQANGGRQIFYVERMDNNHQQLKNIFLAEQTHPQETAAAPVWTVTAASTGHYLLDGQTKDHFVVIDNGYRYEGVPGTSNFTVYHFDRYGVRLNMPLAHSGENAIDGVTTHQLIRAARHHQLTASAELQWRCALPLCVFILTLIAFSLARVKPRQGRFARFFPAILLYIIYANFMLVGQDWISRGVLSPYLGLWILHALMLAVGLILYKRAR